MAESRVDDTGVGKSPASAPPTGNSPGRKFQTLQNPLIFMLAAVCGLCLAVPKAIARIIWANALLLVILLLLSALAGYFIDVYLEKYDSVYTATGTIRILPIRPPDPIHPSAPADAATLENEKAIETQRFRSELLVDDLMKDLDHPIQSTDWWKVTCGKDAKIAHELLSENLNVDPMPGSMLMRISFSTPNKADAPVVLTAVVDRAIRDQRDFTRDKYDSDRKRIYDLSNRYQIQLRSAIDDVKLKIEELAQLGANPLGLVGSSEDRNVAGPKEIEVNARANERVGLQTAKIDTDNAIAELNLLKNKGQVPPQVQQMIDEDRSVISFRDTLDNIAMQLGDAQGKGTTRSADSEHLTNEQALWQKRFDDLKAQKLTQYLAAYSSQLARSKQTIDSKLDHCNMEIARLEFELADIANKTMALRLRQEDVQVYREYYKEYDKGLTDVDQLIRQNETSSMEWFARPREPSTREFPILANIMKLTILCGLELGLGIAFLRALVKWGRS